MQNIKACKSFVRKIIRAAKSEHVICLVYCEGSFFTQTDTVSQTIDAIFAADETTLKFLDRTTEKTLGEFYFVLEFDSSPFEIVQDHTDNDFCNRIMESTDVVGAMQ